MKNRGLSLSLTLSLSLASCFSPLLVAAQQNGNQAFTNSSRFHKRPYTKALALPGEKYSSPAHKLPTAEATLAMKQNELRIANINLKQASQSGNVELTQFYSQQIQNLDSDIEYIEKQLRSTKAAR